MHEDEARPIHTSLEDLPPELARRAETELDRSERIVWVGQPRPDLYAKASGFMFVMGIFFTGFALLWMAFPLGFGLLAAGAGGEGGILLGMPCMCFSLFGVPFVAIGIGMLTSPIWQKKLARKCCYVLTDRRAIAWEPRLFGGLTVRSYSRTGLGRITRIENADGSGSLVFHEYTVSDSDGSTTHRHGFVHIDDVRFVERLVRKTLVEEERA